MRYAAKKKSPTKNKIQKTFMGQMIRENRACGQSVRLESNRAIRHSRASPSLLIYCHSRVRQSARRISAKKRSGFVRTSATKSSDGFADVLVAKIRRCFVANVLWRKSGNLKSLVFPSPFGRGQGEGHLVSPHPPMK